MDLLFPLAGAGLLLGLELLWSAHASEQSEPDPTGTDEYGGHRPSGTDDQAETGSTGTGSAGTGRAGRRGVDRAGADRAGGSGDGRARAPELTMEFGLFSLAFIQRRLDALAAELDRLDHDPEIYAKAFHTLVARATYQELLADASRLTDLSRRSVGPTLEVELVESSAGRREVLEL